MHLPRSSHEKRKVREDEVSQADEFPSKKQLNDAFKSLSIQNARSRHHLVTENSGSSTGRRSPKVKVTPMGDTEMRDPASYAKDAHTIYVNSLDDESDFESFDDEPRFVFNLPGSIDTTFAGSRGIPDSLLKTRRAEENQLILYKGPPEEIVERAWEGHREGKPQADAIEKSSERKETSVVYRSEDVMEVD